MAESDRYFPASLAKAYFNWCAAFMTTSRDTKDFLTLLLRFRATNT